MEKTITLYFSPVNVCLDVTEGLSEKEMLYLAKQEAVKSIERENFHDFKYSVVDGSVMDDNDLQIGRPVKLKDSGDIGIIYDIKPKQKLPIKIVLQNGQMINASKAILEKASRKTSIEKLIKGRLDWEKEMNEWYPGKTAFLVTKKGITPVVISTGRTNLKAYVVAHDTSGRFYTLTQNQAQQFLHDTYIEAEKAI